MKKKIIFFLLLAGLSSTGWCVYTQIYFAQTDEIIIRCKYMTYACGECYPRWKIDSINSDFGKAVGLDTKVHYKGNMIDELLDNELSGCLICYDFYFTGILKRTLNKKYKFEAENYEYKLKIKDCCE